MYNLYYRWAASEEGRGLNSITRSWSTNCTIVERRLHCIRGQYKYLHLLLGTLKKREAEPMMKMFNSCIRSELDYCCLICNPVKKEDIDKIERIQRSFTAKIKGLEEMDYHERLKTLNTYSLERRREHFFI